MDLERRLEQVDDMNYLGDECKVIFYTILRGLQFGRKGQRIKEVLMWGFRIYEGHPPDLGNEPRSRASANPKPDKAPESTADAYLIVHVLQKLSCEFGHF